MDLGARMPGFRSFNVEQVTEPFSTSESLTIKGNTAALVHRAGPET